MMLPKIYDNKYKAHQSSQQPFMPTESELKQLICCAAKDNLEELWALQISDQQLYQDVISLTAPVINWLSSISSGSNGIII